MTADQWLPGEQDEGKWMKGWRRQGRTYMFSFNCGDGFTAACKCQSVMYILNVQCIEDQSYLKKAILLLLRYRIGENICTTSIWERTFIQNVKNLLQFNNKTVLVLEAQSCWILCDPMDGILQARILEWLPFPSPRDLLHPGIKPASPVSPAVLVDSSLSEPPTSCF